MLSLLILFLLLEIHCFILLLFHILFQCCFVMRAYHVLTGKELATDFYS